MMVFQRQIWIRGARITGASAVRQAFTLLEMLTTTAALVILMGLMISLARDVQRESSEQLTRQLLRQLDDLALEYESRTKTPLADVPLFLGDGTAIMPSEPKLTAAAQKNNEAVVRLLRGEILRWRGRAASPSIDSAEMSNLPDAKGTSSQADPFGQLPLSLYDEVTLRDAWGKPIVYMSGMHAGIGMALLNRPSFFFSAGPDGKYLTLADNLYSYETRQSSLAGEPKSLNGNGLPGR